MSNAIENALAIAAKRTNTSPTDAQKAADSYAKGKVEIHGLPVNIENPKGSERSGVDKGGKRWSVTMPAHYGEVGGTEGKDGDPVDVYIGSDHASKRVFVVDQVDARTGKFDEHKAMLSYASKADALADYRKAFSDGKANDRIGAVTEMTTAVFRDWLKSGNTKKPLADSSKSGREQPMARDTKSTASALNIARRFATGGAVRGYADGGMTDSFEPELPISGGNDRVKAAIEAYRPELAIGPASKPSMQVAPLPPPAQTEYVYVTKHPRGHKQHRALDGKFRSDPKVEIARRAGGAVTRPSFDATHALGKARAAKADGGGIPYAADVDDTTWHPGTVTRESVRAYDPSIRDRASDFIREKVFGDSRAPEVDRFVTGATGSRGNSRDGVSVVEMLSLPAMAAGTAMDVGQHMANGNGQAAFARGVISVPMMLAQKYAGKLIGPSQNDINVTKQMVRREGTPEPTAAELAIAREKLYGAPPRQPVDREAQYQSDLAQMEARRLSTLARDESAIAKQSSAPQEAYKSGDLKILNEPSYVKDARATGAPEQAPPPEWYRGVRDFWDMPKPERLHASGGRVQTALDAAKKYATGGAVHVGPVMGATGGRADELPVSVPSGSFVVPADVVSSLGQGNSVSGMENLKKQFPNSAHMGRASGGVVPVPIKISDGEFVISPEDVAAIGGGDMAKGHKTLDAMMVKLRKDHIKTLAALPPPSK